MQSCSLRGFVLWQELGPRLRGMFPSPPSTGAPWSRYAGPCCKMTRGLLQARSWQPTAVRGAWAVPQLLPSPPHWYAVADALPCLASLLSLPWGGNLGDIQGCCCCRSTGTLGPIWAWASGVRPLVRRLQGVGHSQKPVWTLVVQAHETRTCPNSTVETCSPPPPSHYGRAAYCQHHNHFPSHDQRGGCCMRCFVQGQTSQNTGRSQNQLSAPAMPSSASRQEDATQPVQRPVCRVW